MRSNEEPVSIRPLSQAGVLPTDRDGSLGTNRYLGTSQISAATDAEAVDAWLAEYPAGSPTWRTYSREAERVVLWAIHERHKAFSALNRDDFDDYERFLGDPPERWCAPRSTRRESDLWRPFEGPLSPTSRRLAMVVVNALCSWLVSARYLAGNPLALRRSQPGKTMGGNDRAARRESQAQLEKQQMITRFLPRTTFEWLIGFMDKLPEDTPRQLGRKRRAQFAIPFLQQTGLRLSEFCMAQMSDVRKDAHGWWIHVLGKGRKLDRVPLPEDALAALSQYRAHYGLPVYPRSGELFPLIFQLQDREPLEPGSFYRWLRSLLTDAARAAQAAKLDEHAAILERTSTHWFRHTAFSHQADAGVDLRIIQANARHKSIATTSLYLHAGDAEQHWQTTAKHQVEPRKVKTRCP